MRKLFFGATTERVLRETDIPVLVTPAVESGPLYLEDVRQTIGRVLAPVDLTAASEHQVQVAGALASAIDVPLLLAHVVEPLRFPGPPSAHRPRVDAERRTRSEDALQELIAAVPAQVRTEALTAFGDPAEEIAKIARSGAPADRDRPARLAAGRPAHGIGDVSRAVSVANARARPAAGRPCVGRRVAVPVMESAAVSVIGTMM